MNDENEREEMQHKREQQQERYIFSLNQIRERKQK